MKLLKMHTNILVITGCHINNTPHLLHRNPILQNLFN